MDMDVESVNLELLGLPPAEFTAARDERVTQARKAGNRELATAIAKLRKPTVAAWTAGLLARHRPKEAQQLLRLGEALRAAHRTLDGAQLRKLSHDQHMVIGHLARTARDLAAEAGQTVSEPVLHEVEQILHAVLADAEVAASWSAGRLVKTPDAAAGFTGLEPQPGATAPRKAEELHPPGPAKARTPAPDTDGTAEQAHRARLEAARAESAETQAEAERLEAGQAAARDLVDSTAASVAAAEEQTRAAAEQLETARTAHADAAARLRQAERAAAKASRRAETAARNVEKLTRSEK
ncbi:hypothetical protein [Streptomyces sp. NPDC059957]|uniref:hypothetical protein n=1 Tax=unclassified Streptomyces TaxID=2593676 RepID=UPI0036590AAF